MEKEKRCLSCEVTVTGGMLIKDFCKDTKEACNLLIKEFLKGNMTVRNVQKRLNIPEQAIEPFKQEGVYLDLTLAEAVDLDNKENNKNHLTG